MKIGEINNVPALPPFSVRSPPPTDLSPNNMLPAFRLQPERYRIDVFRNIYLVINKIINFISSTHGSMAPTDPARRITTINGHPGSECEVCDEWSAEPSRERMLWVWVKIWSRTKRIPPTPTNRKRRGESERDCGKTKVAAGMWNAVGENDCDNVIMSTFCA